MLRPNDHLELLGEQLLWKATGGIRRLYLELRHRMTAQFNRDSANLSTKTVGQSGAMTSRDVHQTLNLISTAMHRCQPRITSSVADRLSLGEMLGERVFVLGGSGHIQTIVCPPGNSKPLTSQSDNSSSPEEWLRTATRSEDTCGSFSACAANDLARWWPPLRHQGVRDIRPSARRRHLCLREGR